MSALKSAATSLEMTDAAFVACRAKTEIALTGCGYFLQIERP